MKRVLTVFSAFLLLILPASAKNHTAEDAVKQSIQVEPVKGLSEDFMRGVDISSLSDIEKCGGKYFGADGKEEDLFKILKDNGVNWVRLRVWNNPVEERDVYAKGKVVAKKGDPIGGGNNSVENDLDMAVRAKKAGMKLLIDFHYSDSWADPGKQKMPQDWKNLDDKELNKALEKFTKDSLKKFIDAGARPDMVQIGNEMNDGFMWPKGKIWENKAFDTIGGFSGWTTLLKSASKGVRAAQGKGEKIKIVIHLANGGDKELYRSVFDQVKKAGVDYDVIGLSFYTYWHGAIDDLVSNMKELAKTYKKEMVVVETAYGFTTEDGDAQGNVFMTYSDENHGYLPSVQGQATAIRDVIAAVASVNGGNGVFYWEPAWIPVEGAGLSTREGDTWENQCMFDFQGRALPSLAVWNLVYGRGSVKNAWGGSASNGTNFIPYDVEEKIQLKTTPATAPKLPARVKLLYTNDSAAMTDVTWENKDWKKVTQEGLVEVKGSVKGSDYKVTAYVSVSNQVNIITDPSWESGKLGEWKLNGPGQACFVENNKNNARTGKWTYKYWLDTGFKSTLTRTFTNIPNGNYTFSLWAMGGGGENQIRIFATGHDGSSKQISAKVENTGWKNWVQYSIEIPVSSQQVTIGIYLDTKAGCWGNFDDLELYKHK